MTQWLRSYIPLNSNNRYEFNFPLIFQNTLLTASLGDIGGGQFANQYYINDSLNNPISSVEVQTDIDNTKFSDTFFMIFIGY